MDQPIAEVEVEAPEETTPEESQPDNLQAKLRSLREEIGENSPMDIEIPGYDGVLWARYRRIPWADIKKIQEKTEKSKNPRRELMGAADTLVQSCEMLMIKDTDDLKPINEAFPELGDEPVGYVKEIGSVMGFEAETARQVLLKLFNNDLAVNSQYIEVSQWMRESRREGDADF